VPQRGGAQASQVTALARLRDRYVITGALGALLALSVLLVHLPATIYGGNAADLAFGLSDFLIVAVLVLLPALVLVIMMLVALPPSAKRIAAGVLCAIGVLFWLYGNFSVGDSLVLDGRARDVRFVTRLGWWELVVIAAAALVLGTFATRLPRPTAIFLAALNVGLAAGTAWELARDPRFMHPANAADSGKLFRFSTQGNTLIVLMDSLQSDVFARVVRADASIRDALQGFTLYRNTVGVAPTTLLSIPAIHSGLRYQPGESIDAYYDRAVSKGSLLNRFADAGYEATLVNAMRGACPAKATCLEPVHLVGSRAEELWKSSLRMMDFALLRVTPFVLKPHVFNDQRWLLSSRWQYSIFVDNVQHGNALVERVAANGRVESGPPTIKFLHLMNTHAPFILLDDCTTYSEDLLLPLPDAQVRCALGSFVRLLDRLKKEGLYDAAAIALFADHGYSLPSDYQRAEDQWGPWGELIGAANPVFAFKAPRAQGALVSNDDPLVIADVATFACRAAGVNCALPASPEPSLATSRELMWYRWEDIGWGRAEVSAAELGTYAIAGPVWERGSWRVATPLPRRYRLGVPLGFMPGDSRPELSPFEWSIAQAPGTWTEGHTASVAMNFGSAPGADLDLEADAYAFLPPQRPVQRVYVFANDVEVAQWRFDVADQGGVRRARVPKSAMSSGVLRVTFKMPDAVSPRSLGLSTDPRSLSMGLRRLVVTPAGDAQARPDASANGPRGGESIRTTKDIAHGKR
jgi:hypothetical protein